MAQSDTFNLNRFVEAQQGVYAVALSELRLGRKRSHWMWFIFPQHNSLGHSYYSKYYGVSGIAEARAYLEHPVLGGRLREVAQTLLDGPAGDARAIFGDIDAKKLRSSMTLFDLASPDDVFGRVLDKFFNGRRDPRTIHLLGTRPLQP